VRLCRCPSLLKTTTGAHKEKDKNTDTSINHQVTSLSSFYYLTRPGAKAVRPDALSRMPGDRPNKHDTSDDRVKNRMRTVLTPEVLSEDILTDLLNTNSLNAAPLILPAMDRPMDDLITSAYATNLMAIDMTTALSDPTIRRWPKHLRKILRAPMLDFTVRQGCIWFRERLFAPPDDKLRTHILYRTHNTAPAGHPGRVKTTELVTRDYWWPRMRPRTSPVNEDIPCVPQLPATTTQPVAQTPRTE
jgi:hypothetical protein